MTSTWDSFPALNPQASSAWEKMPSLQGRKSPQEFEEELTEEEYESLPFGKKIRYAEQLGKNLEKESEQALSRRYLKGLTLGLSEKIPGIEEIPEAPEGLGGIGELLGESLPVSKIFKGISLIPKIGKNVPRTLKFLEKVGRTGLAGATVGGIKGATEGKNIPLAAAIGGIEFAALHSVLSGLGAGGKYIWNQIKNLPAKEAKTAAELLIGKENLPLFSQTAEEILSTLQQEEAPRALTPERITGGKDVGVRPSAMGQPKGAPSLGVEIPQPQIAENPFLQGRVTRTGSPLRGVPQAVQQELEPIGRIVSPVLFENKAQGGQALEANIQTFAQNEREFVRAAYENAENISGTATDIFPDLASNLRERLTALEQTISPNPAQQIVIRELENILNELEVGGHPVQIPVQRLLRTSDSLLSRLNQEDLYGDAKNLLRVVGHDLNQAAFESLEAQGLDAGVIQEADQLYGAWAQRFSNDEISPFLQRRNLNPEALFTKTLSDRGTYRAVQNAIGETPEGLATLSVVNREIVEKELAPYLENPKKIGTPKFTRTIAELRPIIGEEAMDEIETRLEAQRSKFMEKKLPPKKVEVISPKKPFTAEKKEIGATGKVPAPKPAELTPSQKLAAKYIEKKPEDISKLMNTRSGIRELKKDLKTKGAKSSLFETLKRQKIRQIIKQGKIKKDVTGQELFDVINKENNFEILSELIGEPEVEAALDVAEEIGKKHVSREFKKKFIKKAAFVKFVHSFWPLII